MPFPDSQYPSVLRGYDKRQSERLLNAAPALLKACRAIFDEIDSWVWCNKGGEVLPFGVSSGYAAYIQGIAKDAIAKAEGRGE